MRCDELVVHGMGVLLDSGRWCLCVGIVLILHVLWRDDHVLHLLSNGVSVDLLQSLSLAVALKDLLNVEGVRICSKNIVLLVARAKVWIHLKDLFVLLRLRE